MDDTRPCENCGAPLPRTGTFCLACNTPVSGQREGGLSVAATNDVRHGRPIMGIALVAGCVLALAGVTYALVMLVQPHDARDARQAVTGGVGMLVRAESGKHVCRGLNHYLAGPRTDYLAACQALVGTDPGMKLTSVHAGAVHLDGAHGTVHLTGTLDGAAGAKPLDRVFEVREVTGNWRLDWDGTSIG